jgi:hypothetical protein
MEMAGKFKDSYGPLPMRFGRTLSKVAYMDHAQGKCEIQPMTEKSFTA